VAPVISSRGATFGFVVFGADSLVDSSEDSAEALVLAEPSVVLVSEPQPDRIKPNAVAIAATPAIADVFIMNPLS
jgi:ABC-type hemin transport system substrate-binding protein